ncbi:hypothetical protein AB0I55_22420 [Actinocatenispora sera]
MPDGSAIYAQAVLDAGASIVRASDRWHLWHNLAAAVDKTVTAHASCWNSLPHHTSKSWKILRDCGRKRHGGWYAAAGIALMRNLTMVV